MIIKGTDRYASRLIFHEVFIHLESDLSEMIFIFDRVFVWSYCATNENFECVTQRRSYCSVTTILFRHYFYQTLVTISSDSRTRLQVKEN
jgi:hypothetical protein